MARKTAKQDDRNWVEDYADGGINYLGLDEEILQSMRSYIDYTLTDRALPYIDGLKPVHRAILWCMWDKGLKHNAGRAKSLAVSGDVVGRAHPHSGDAVYGAIAGMTRSNGDDSRCGACGGTLCTIDGKGNWGAEFFDKPASPRYTEIRLSKSGEACVQDVPKGAVFMNPTFDAKWVLPEVLPVRLPLLLINGCDGLAYGYNVQWLPHNPAEALAAVITRMDNPKCTAADIRKVMPGPDFPSGGIIVDRSENGIDAGFETGKGNMSVTSRYTISKEGRRNIISFYETPYMVARSGGKRTDKVPASIVMGVTKFAEEHPQYGITDVKNLSDKDHECLVEVSVKSAVNPEVVAAALVNAANRTRLTETVSYRQSAVIGDYEESPVPDASGAEGVLKLSHLKPQDLNMLEYLDAFIEFRCACVVNAANSERKKLLRRKHLQDGLLAALLDIDEVISIVRNSQDKESAHKNLKKHFKLDDEQADYVLGISLSRLTRSDRIEIEDETKKMAARIKELEKILSSKKNIRAEVRKQLVELQEEQTLARRTTIVSENGKILAKAAGESRDQQAQAKAIAAAAQGKVAQVSAGKSADGDDDSAPAVPSLIVEGSTNVFLSPDGKICQTTRKAPAHVQKLIDVDLHSTMLLVFEDGNSLRTKVHELPSKPSVVMKKCVGFMDLGKDGELADKQLALATSDGIVKVLKCDTLTKAEECPVMAVNPQAKILAARPYDDSSFFVFITSAANLLRFPVSSVNAQGRTSSGVAGIKLTEGAKVVFASVSPETDIVVSVTNKTAKQTLLSEFPAKGRGSQGVRCHKFLKGEEALTQAYVGAAPAISQGELPELAARDASGKPVEGAGSLSFSEK